MAVSFRHYAEVRGFPRLMAGEDFYMLDKLRKVGDLEKLPGNPILLEARLSDRVPFGTGRALRDMVKGGINASTYPLPHPDSYSYLRAWIEVLNGLSIESSPRRISWRPAHVQDRALEAVRAIVSGGGSSILDGVLEAMNAYEETSRTMNLGLSPGLCRRRLHTWFGAFKTLKLLHGLRDRGLGPGPFFEAMRTAPFASYSGREDVTTALETLVALDEGV
jgi:hypothetical protein